MSLPLWDDVIALVQKRELDHKPLPRRIIVGHGLWKALVAKCETGVVCEPTAEHPWPSAMMLGIQIVPDARMPADEWWPDYEDFAAVPSLLKPIITE